MQNENIDNIEDEYFRILSKDDIKNIMKNYEEQSDSDFHNMKELFKQMYIYDEIEDKCIDIKNESYDNLNIINKKTFDNSITIIDTLKETLKLSEEFIKGNVTFSDDLNPVVFIDMINKNNQEVYFLEY